MLGDYRPENADDEVDIRARFPESLRNLDQFGRLTVNTPSGNVPLSNFVQRVPAPRVGNLERTDGVRVMKLAADVEEDLLVVDIDVGQITRERLHDPRMRKVAGPPSQVSTPQVLVSGERNPV